MILKFSTIVTNGRKMSTSSKPFPYHLVTPSPFPLLTSFSALWLTTGLVLYFHRYSAAGTVVLGALLCLTYTVSLWWRDVMRESTLGFHTAKVKRGLNLGMILFILSEAMFFVGLLWAYMHAALMPTVQIGMSWPPLGIIPVAADSWHARPILNTWLLLASYFTANNALSTLEQNNKQRSIFYLILTIVLAVVFTYYQYLEFSEAAFTFSDSIFGSCFFMITGVHGIHVILGTIYLTVCLLTIKTATATDHTALALAALYWHFVDAIWVFVLLIAYLWGGALPTSGLELCTDGACVLENLLDSVRLDAFEHSSSFFEKEASL
jgi:cytochrome c oxidase subunit 3